MSQVTIFLDEETEKAAREAAAGAKLSLSCWFAKFAERERERERERGKMRSEWGSFFAEFDAVKDDSWTGSQSQGKTLASQRADTPRNSH